MDQATDERALVPTNKNEYLKVGAIIESDNRSIGVQLNSLGKLSTVIGLITKHADCRMTFEL